MVEHTVSEMATPSIAEFEQRALLAEKQISVLTSRMEALEKALRDGTYKGMHFNIMSSNCNELPTEFIEEFMIADSFVSCKFSL